ncbi:hypothetical protein GTPT_1389 [Tatumella ptyseos ATCC 33301]|uniref:Uncharacterized protein n=1 Tax=Tatumella ptyseos ATCC 33301 TaxID=1005995 RepID=A0A085JIK3_9GAMM|nr:hypothetical protein GTPT_1389 [Tatumella ptyseos ATCC 33301]
MFKIINSQKKSPDTGDFFGRNDGNPALREAVFLIKGENKAQDQKIILTL